MGNWDGMSTGIQSYLIDYVKMFVVRYSAREDGEEGKRASIGRYNSVDVLMVILYHISQPG